ncbi:hypothetical protein CFP56_003935 [Quercus suber]|uniref:Zinc knuckle CX2CX4HX4C domain-containing protein n=1 Tax=Quercus suber TaxID=58331 RepID=A0AAW0II05_QUESU
MATKYDGTMWGKCLRVRVRIDVTKRLVRGKRITAEGGEPKWVNFKYERLPSFYYKCGLLNQSLKECSEGQAQGDKEGASQLQYGAWLKREPMRRGGKEAFAQGARSELAKRNRTTKGSLVVLPEQRHSTKERPKGGGSHVTNKTNQKVSHPIRDVGAVTSRD